MSRCPSINANLLSWTRAVLKEFKIRPKKSLGQHFLVDGRVLRDYYRLAPRGLTIIEVGGGLGALTCLLADIASKLLSVEIDPVLAKIASMVTRGLDNTSIIVGDGVKHVGSGKAGFLASNLPYNSASQILVAAAKNNSIQEVLVVIQEDVARKIVAKPGERNYGRITAFLRYYFDASIEAHYPPSSFYPKPEVAGALLRLRRIRPWARGDEAFEDLLRCLFSYKNKVLKRAASYCNLPIEGLGDMLSRRVRDFSPEELYHLSQLSGQSGRG
ncbi:MAG: hypothetical protein LRS46_04105 [Desulfurococcales archaeon]|nr:hypothetical protein [Desulfurococcales archaeon]